MYQAIYQASMPLDGRVAADKHAKKTSRTHLMNDWLIRCVILVAAEFGSDQKRCQSYVFTDVGKRFLMGFIIAIRFDTCDFGQIL